MFVTFVLSSPLTYFILFSIYSSRELWSPLDIQLVTVLLVSLRCRDMWASGLRWRCTCGMWHILLDMWYVELALGGSKVHTGCSRKLVWMHTPWLGAHAPNGRVGPLCRALQGLDPRKRLACLMMRDALGKRM